MRIIVNAVTNMVQEIICKWEKLRMRSQYGARDNLQMRDNWKCGHNMAQEIICKWEKLQMQSQIWCRR